MYIIGSHAKLLHFPAGNFSIRSGSPIGTIRGMGMETDQRAVCCMPEAGPILLCYRDGYYARVDKTFKAKSSARVGVQLITHHSDVVWAQPYPEAVASTHVLALLRSDGSLLVIDPLEAIDADSKTKRLRGIALANGKELADAVLLPRDMLC